MKGYRMRFYGRRVIQSIAVVASFFVAGVVSPIYAQGSSGQFIIQNPYAGVNWGTWGRYKAQFHAHSTDSDGDHTRAEMLEDHYRKGFDIVAFTEHDFLTTAWDGPSNPRPNDSGLPMVPLTSARRAEMEAGVGRGGRGMIGIANTIEHTTFRDEDPFDEHHINTFNAPFHNLPMNSRTIAHVLARAQELGGISYINHPGRNTDGRNSNTAIGIANSNNPVYIQKYVDLFMAYESCVGMEIINKLDADSRTDRILWDNILKQTMPAGRNVWGFSTDDTHSIHASGFAYNIMLMPELSQEATLNAMRSGTFYAVSHVDRLENINVVSHWSGRESHAFWLDRTLPSVTNIVVSGSTITITGANFTTIDWIADGVKIATGSSNSINLNNHANSVNSYVRAQLRSANGIVYLQPFGVRRPSELSGVTQPAAITGLTNGTAKTTVALGLPVTIPITTTAGQTINVAVNWNVAAAAYDPGLKTEQTFTVGGTFALPAGVTNGGNIPLTVTVSVTVKREVFTVVASNFGDSYYRYGRTNSAFHPDAFDMSALTGWTLSPTATGFGTASSAAALTLATTLVNGPGAAEAGASNARHTWTYFKRAFSLPNNVIIDDVLGAFGAHRIDDALIIYINGIEVYRYNAGGTGGNTAANGATNVTINAPINWATYTGYNTNATTQPFNINSDYNNRETGLSSVSDGSPIILDAASLTNLRSALILGVNVITCLVGQNAASSSDLWFDLELSIETALVPFVPVTGITGVPAAMTVSAGLSLAGTVAPANATNSTVVWSVEDAGTTGAAIDGNTLSAAEAGSVTVRATIVNGTAPGTDYTRDFTITVSGTTSALFSDRVVSGADEGIAVVALSGVPAAGFSVGPNPVSRSSGVVKFYRLGGAVQKGRLTIYDASGNVVNKIRVGEGGNRGNAPSRVDAESSRVFGVWNLTDRRGRPVAEGTYLVRGVITTSDGKRERMSAVVGVR
jgi:hypothetical protein